MSTRLFLVVNEDGSYRALTDKDAQVHGEWLNAALSDVQMHGLAMPSPKVGWKIGKLTDRSNASRAVASVIAALV